MHVNHDIARGDASVAISPVAEEFVHLPADHLGPGVTVPAGQKHSRCTLLCSSFHGFALRFQIFSPPCPVFALGFSQYAAQVCKPPH